MDKKEQIKFLEGELQRTIMQRLEVEALLIGLQRANLVGKDQYKLNEAMKGNISAKENLDMKIDAYRELIKRVQNGVFTL